MLGSKRDATVGWALVGLLLLFEGLYSVAGYYTMLFGICQTANIINHRLLWINGMNVIYSIVQGGSDKTADVL